MIRLPDKGYRLSPAFDIASSRLALPNESDEMAIAINGKQNKIKLNDFRALAKSLEMNDKNFDDAVNRVKLIKTSVDKFLNNSFLPAEFKA